ncbi:PREDICTED: protein ARABIDOPSIS THALIANA ANTHER 7-like [Camelina sativa]|uniref:Protein ARABIDOPSIS THALIANA ANTHER 7-like n=1 Tax=Camelina sativa TaxID=90675 RepID=A0ABM0UY11_CAMSA|nr:PREDICTED: protein ARABIDOPSIS THALIANA ANTHER 7-like [Camelina sativa]
MHRALLLMILITSAVSMSEEEQCRDMFENFIEGIPLQPSPQYCRGVSRLNNVLKLTSPITLQGLKKKNGKEEVRIRCDCPELEVIWKVRCVPCAQNPDPNITQDESHVLSWNL